MSCQVELGYPSFEAFLAPYYDDRATEVECSRGHKTVLILQSQKFEVLLESGADALAAEFTLEAAATFSAALERFIEFAGKVLLVHNGMSNSVYEVMFKEMARQSERQVGCFIALHALVFGLPYVPNKAIAPFRNSVIHKGEIPTPERARIFCTDVYAEIYRTAVLLRQHCQEAITAVISEDLCARRARWPADIRISTASTNGVYSLTSVDNKATFEEAFQTYLKGRDLISQSVPQMNEIHRLLFPKATDV